MTTVLAIIMSVMILILAFLVAGVALLAHDIVKERDSLRVWNDKLELREAHLNEMHDEIVKDVNEHYNNIVNQHDLS